MLTTTQGLHLRHASPSVGITSPIFPACAEILPGWRPPLPSPPFLPQLPRSEPRRALRRQVMADGPPPHLSRNSLGKLLLAPWSLKTASSPHRGRTMGTFGCPGPHSLHPARLQPGVPPTRPKTGRLPFALPRKGADTSERKRFISPPAEGAQLRTRTRQE